jgi:hypothetical protein
MMRRSSWQIACAALMAGAVVFFAMGAGQSTAPPADAKTPTYKTVYVAGKPLPPVNAAESSTAVDPEGLKNDIEKQLKNLAKDGFEIVEIMPIETGVYKYDWKQTVQRESSASAYGWGYGFGITGGVMIIAVKH